jgi:hypothetical protein
MSAAGKTMPMTTSTMMVAILAAFRFALPAQTQAPFTVQHTIQFKPGTDQERTALKVVPSLRFIVAENFEIAREDLDDDGSKETIVMAASSLECGSGGCGTVVLENRGGRTVAILDNINLHAPLAVTNEKVGRYRALATVDARGVILSGDQRGTPMFGKQLVYPMNVTDRGRKR